MAVVLNHTAVRALLLAVILACVAAVTAPVARGETAVGTQQAARGNETNSSISPPAPSCLPPAAVLLADEWSWHEFVKFWGRQFGSMTGVLGTVLLVGAAAVLLILYKGKG